jgi:phosphoglycolate phosphatase
MSFHRRFDLIAFDWDGTLYDSTGLIARCIQSASVDVGQPKPSNDAARYVIGLGLQAALQHAVPQLALERYPELLERYRLHYRARQQEVVLFEGVLLLLAELKRRDYRLAVATGKSRQGLNEALQSTELKGLFEATRTADETASKPSPQMLFELMDELGVPLERTLMIGDTTHDLQMALNAGVASVAVSYGAHERGAFADFPVQFVAHSVQALRNWLQVSG